MTRKKSKNKPRVNRSPEQLLADAKLKSTLRKAQSTMQVDRPGVDKFQSVRASQESGHHANIVDTVSKPKATAKPVSLLLTVADLCALLKVSRSTITRMERDGSLPGRVMVGGSVRYHRETIECWLRERVV